MRMRMMAGAILITMVIPAVLSCDPAERPRLALGSPAVAAQDGRTAAVEAAGNVTTRRVWAGGASPYPWAVSADGRYVTATEPNGDLAVRDLVSGEAHQVVTVRNLASAGGSASASVFSRDGSRLAFVLIGGKSTWGLVNDIYVIDFDGGGSGGPLVSEPRVIHSNPMRYHVAVWDWSPDGRWVIGKSYGPDNSTAIELYSTAGEPTRTFKSFDNWREPSRATFSPDGRFVAYDLPSASDPKVRAIYVVSQEGSREHLVVDDGSQNRLFGWDPDGNLLYVTERTGAPSLWRLPMADGVPSGPPELLREDLWNADPIGLAGNSLYYNVQTEQPTLHLAGLDLFTGRLTTTPRPVRDAARGRQRGYAWSRDGRYLAVLYQDVQGRGRLVVLSEDGVEISHLALDLDGTQPRWTSDGEAVVIKGFDGKRRHGFHRVTLKTGAVELMVRLVQGENFSASHFDLSPDGATLYYAHSGQDRAGLMLVAHDLISGSERTIAPSSFPGRLALSPDGNQLALVTGSIDQGVVAVVPTAGGPYRELFRVATPATARVNGLQWTPDGEYVVAQVFDQATRGTSAVLLPARGGEPRSLEGIPGSVRSLGLHPSGRRLAYVAGDNRNEIWALDRGAGANTPASGAEARATR